MEDIYDLSLLTMPRPTMRPVRIVAGGRPHTAVVAPVRLQLAAFRKLDESDYTLDAIETYMALVVASFPDLGDEADTIKPDELIRAVLYLRDGERELPNPSAGGKGSPSPSPATPKPTDKTPKASLSE